MCLFIQHNFVSCAHTMEQEIECEHGPCGKLSHLRSYHQGSCSECSGLSPYEAIRQARVRSDVLMAEPKEVDDGGDPDRTPRASKFAQPSLPEDGGHNSEEDVGNYHHLDNENDYHSSEDNCTPHASNYAKLSLADPGDQVPHDHLCSTTPTDNTHPKLFGCASNNGPIQNAKHTRTDAVDFGWYNRTFRVNKSGGFQLGDPFTVPTYKEAVAEAGMDPTYSMHGGITGQEDPEPALNANLHAASLQPSNTYTYSSGAPVPVYYGQASAPAAPFYSQNHGQMMYAYTLQRLPGYPEPVWVASPYPIGMAMPAQPYPAPYPHFNQLRRREAYSHLRGGGGVCYQDALPDWTMIKDLGGYLPGPNESVASQADKNDRRVRFNPVVSVGWIMPRQPNASAYYY